MGQTQGMDNTEKQTNPRNGTILRIGTNPKNGQTEGMGQTRGNNIPEEWDMGQTKGMGPNRLMNIVKEQTNQRNGLKLQEWDKPEEWEFLE
ncbi:uncharacterized [Tachysurus ichikawai]